MGGARQDKQDKAKGPSRVNQRKFRSTRKEGSDGASKSILAPYKKTLAWLLSHPQDAESDKALIAASLEFSNLCFNLGQGFNDAMKILQSANSVADRSGDRRSKALINLHLGRLFYFAEQRLLAMEYFTAGKDEVENLGDEDILSRASEFIGLYYFLQGIFPEAKRYFESAASVYETEEWSRSAINPSGPMWLGYCSAFMGQYHEAIGTIDYYRRLALDRSAGSLAVTLRSVLGIILLMMNKRREAFFHLSGALQEATVRGNALAKYFAKGGIAYHDYLEGRIQEAKEKIEEVAQEGAPAGLIHQYASPMWIEMIYDLKKQGLELIAPLDYRNELDSIMHGPNLHLRGVALRIRAKDASKGGENDDAIERDLENSEAYLKQSGDPIQLAKTRIEMARLKIRKGEKEKARVLAQKAWKGFSGYGDVHYPDDLRHLLVIKSDMAISIEQHDRILESYMEMIQGLEPGADLDEILHRAVVASNRFFGAERGGVFWFGSSSSKNDPVLRGPYNLSPKDVINEDFRQSLSLVFKAYRENMPQIVRMENSEFLSGSPKEILCVPLEIGGRVQAVLYLSNSLDRHCFDHFERSQITQMFLRLTTYVENHYRQRQWLEQKISTRLDQLSHTDSQDILAESPMMLRLLEQADRIAVSGTTTLILGETGVGKELLAHRLHKKSLRHDQPFVIIELTSIPESLMESELFGHEKGAFTGADSQKIGRMELAHRGTLFLDEIGEIPPSVQVKLLRVLQDGKLFRVGGTKAIQSDFRLIAATNRTLTEEISSGRFREDLYYRLNVMSMTIPPLRQRKEDILLLARYFLNKYAAKYSHHRIDLSADDRRKLTAYDWPGNVRELKNVIERAVILWTGGPLSLDIPLGRKSSKGNIYDDLPTFDEMQRRYIRHVLEITGGKIGGPGGAAERLGIKRTTLNHRMKTLGLHKTLG